jgi:hypothetical protein
MRVITVVNPKVLDVPYSVVSTDYSSGTVLYVEDSAGFGDNDLILVGAQGDEKAEVTDLTSTPPNTTSFNVTALDFPHDADDPVQKVLYDQYEIDYKAAVGDAWISLITGQPFDWGKDKTEYVHSAGLSTYFYRSRYYNSATSTYSDYSDTVVGTGYSRLQVGWLIERVRTKAQDKNKQHASDKDIIASFNTVNDVVRGLNRRWWFLKAEYDFVTVAGQKGYTLPDDFDRGYRLKYNYNDGTNNVEYYLRYLGQTEFDYNYQDNNATDDDDIQHYTVDIVNNKILLGPIPETAGYSLTLTYFKTLDDVDTYGDTLTVPLADLYVHYATAEIWETKDNEKKAQYHKKEFANLLSVLEQMRVKNYAPRSVRSWKGRNVMQRWYGSAKLSTDDERERYW